MNTFSCIGAGVANNDKKIKNTNKISKEVGDDET